MKILSIGIPIKQDSVTLTNNIQEMDSLFNFELVIIHPRYFLPFQEVKDWENKTFADESVLKWQELINKIQVESALLLENGGTIISLLTPSSTISSEYYYNRTKKIRIVSNYDWVPLREKYNSFFYNIAKGKGTELTIKNDSEFSPYLKMQETNWEAQFNTTMNLELDSHLFDKYQFNDHITPTEKVLAINKANRVVGIQFLVEKGKLIFLPTSTHENYADIIIDCVNKVTKKQVRDPPSWISDYKYPEEEKLRKSMDELGTQLQDLSKKFQKIKKNYEEKSSIKKLLYEQGYELEDVVKDVFEEIGFTMTKKDDKDWFAKSGDKEAIVEVTGHEKDIDIKKLRQLINYHLEEEKTTGKFKHAIMVGNHFINEDPRKRKNAYTEKAIQQAAILSITLINTVDLFDIVCRIRKGDIDKKLVREKLLKSNGLYAFEDC